MPSSAVTRLIDMGVEPFLLSSSLLGVLAQRLVRKLCPHCKQKEPDAKSWRAVGCTACGDTGYLGRTGIHELLLINDELRLLIHNGANDTDVRRTGERSGMLPLRGDAMRWVASGTTSLEEVVRVTRE